MPNAADSRQPTCRERGGSRWFLVKFATFFQVALMFGGIPHANAGTVDLVVNVVSDQPAYMSFDLEHFTVTVSNNGPDLATNVFLKVDHQAADIPFETSATCLAVPGPNPNGPAICPAGSGTSPSSAFTRVGQSFNVIIPQVPSQSQVQVHFDNRGRCIQPEGREPFCVGPPTGNFLITATVSSAESDVLEPTNTATTNILLYPPDIQYKVAITGFPATAQPGDVVEYYFEVQSMGIQPSDKLRLRATIEGRAGTMVPLTATNNPNGSNGSTLPNTTLNSIDCLSTTLGTYPFAMVFPSAPALWQACPTSNQIPIPKPMSVTNVSPITGFPFPTDFLDNLPGTLDAPSAGGVMRFKANVTVGDPICVAAADSGNRDLVFKVQVAGLPLTDLVSPGSADNTDSVTTLVPGNCEEADIEFTTSGTPSSITVDASGDATWTHTTVVSNLSVGANAGTATNVPVEFKHFQWVFTETQGPLTCVSVPASPNLCPSLSGSTGSNSGFSFSTNIPSLPPGSSVTFSQSVTVNRTGCWPDTSALINLAGTADPSPGLVDPVYSSTTPPRPPSFTTGINTFFQNNGMQTVVEVGGLTLCPGGPGSDGNNISIVKSGPYASAANATAGTPLIGQSSATFLADATQVFYKVVVKNANANLPVFLGDIFDQNYSLTPANTTPPSGFTNTGNTLADWGITCIASPLTEACHEMASTTINSGYNSKFRLSYDAALHSGSTQVALAPLATLTYIIPFTTPTHTNKCQPSIQNSNVVNAEFTTVLGVQGTVIAPPVLQWIGTPPCTPGILDIQKEILAPATATFIPLTGLVTYRVTLTNTSLTATLDIPHFIDEVIAGGVTTSVVSIACTAIGGGAKCPTSTVLPGIKTPAVGSPTPLANPFGIDHEWGFVGNNTFPPGGSVEFVITIQLTNPTREFGCAQNHAIFSGENDPNGWVPEEVFVNSCPPKAPEISLQKQVSTQIAGPNSFVTYTVTVTNIGSVIADGTVFGDALPAALLPTNPTGYSNVSCTDLTAQPFVPNPKGVAVCPTITSTSGGLSATIATFGANTALQFTYQAQMPAAPLSIDNLASVSAPSVSGLSFGQGTTQSHQNVQVLSTSEFETVAIPTIGRWQLALLGLLLFALGGLRLSWSRRSI